MESSYTNLSSQSRPSKQMPDISHSPRYTPITVEAFLNGLSKVPERSPRRTRRRREPLSWTTNTSLHGTAEANHETLPQAREKENTKGVMKTQVADGGNATGRCDAANLVPLAVEHRLGSELPWDSLLTEFRPVIDPVLTAPIILPFSGPFVGDRISEPGITDQVSEETKPLRAAQTHVRRRKRNRRAESSYGQVKCKTAKFPETRRKRRAPVNELALVKVIPRHNSLLGELQDPDTVVGIGDLRDDPISNSQPPYARTTTTTQYISLAQPSYSITEPTTDSRKPLSTFQRYFIAPSYVGKSSIDLSKFRILPRSTEPAERRRRRSGSGFDGLTALRRPSTVDSASPQRILKSKKRIRPLTLGLRGQGQRIANSDTRGHDRGPINIGQHDETIVKPTAMKTYSRPTKRKRRVTFEDEIHHRPITVSTPVRAQVKANSDDCHDYKYLDDKDQEQGQEEVDADQGAVNNSELESFNGISSSGWPTNTKGLGMAQADAMQSNDSVLDESKPVNKSPGPNTRFSVDDDAPSRQVPYYGVNRSQVSGMTTDERDDWKVTMPTRRSQIFEVQDEILDGLNSSTSEREYPLHSQGPKPKHASWIFSNICGSSPLAFGRGSSPSLGASIQEHRCSGLSAVLETQEIIGNRICTSKRNSDHRSNKRIFEKASISLTEPHHDGDDGQENDDVEMLDFDMPIATANLEVGRYFMQAEQQLSSPDKGPHQVVRRRSILAPVYLWGTDADAPRIGELPNATMLPGISQRISMTSSTSRRRSHTVSAHSLEVKLKTLAQNTCYDYGTTPARSRRLSLLPFNPPFQKTL